MKLLRSIYLQCAPYIGCIFSYSEAFHLVLDPYLSVYFIHSIFFSLFFTWFYYTSFQDNILNYRRCKKFYILLSLRSRIILMREKLGSSGAKPQSIVSFIAKLNIWYIVMRWVLLNWTHVNWTLSSRTELTTFTITTN
jgi:hypothetical protein